ncbi:hypothetical protein B0H10DRAFT_1953446 [Mycena sp. CBHHK59/15]|nr:hypothetical protein B0H10DRAFT_1953446 [Mycena sp. CBHHK59/15]
MASPHLIPLVRRLRTSLEDNVVRELPGVKFPNLRDVVFHRNSRLERELIKKKTLVVAGTIISLPSIRRVGLLWLTLQNIQDLRRLFDHSSPHLEALLLHEVRISNSSEEPEKPRRAPPLRLATIKQLHVPGVHCPTRALLSALGPFDFSMLEDIEYSIVNRMQYTTALLNRGRSTITRLKVDGTLSQAHIATLALLTALTELHIRTGNTTEDLASVGALLEALPVPSLLEIVALQFEYGQWEIGELDNLRTALMRTPLPSLRRLEIRVRTIVSRTDGVDPRSEIRAALAEFDTMLSVVVLPLFLCRSTESVQRMWCRHVYASDRSRAGPSTLALSLIGKAVHWVHVRQVWIRREWHGGSECTNGSLAGLDRSGVTRLVWKLLGSLEFGWMVVGRSGLGAG